MEAYPIYNRKYNCLHSLLCCQLKISYAWAVGKILFGILQTPYWMCGIDREKRKGHKLKGRKWRALAFQRRQECNLVPSCHYMNNNLCIDLMNPLIDWDQSMACCTETKFCMNWFDAISYINLQKNTKSRGRPHDILNKAGLYNSWSISLCSKLRLALKLKQLTLEMCLQWVEPSFKSLRHQYCIYSSLLVKNKEIAF